MDSTHKEAVGKAAEAAASLAYVYHRIKHSQSYREAIEMGLGDAIDDFERNFEEFRSLFRRWGYETIKDLEKELEKSKEAQRIPRDKG